MSDKVPEECDDSADIDFAAVFKKYDTGGKGFISFENMLKAMRHDLEREEAEEYLKAKLEDFVENHEGNIDLETFIRAYKSCDNEEEEEEEIEE